MANSKSAIAALVCGISGFLLGLIPIIGFGLQVAAIVTGIIGIKSSSKGLEGKGMAITGLVLGILGLIFSLIFGLLIFIGILGGIPRVGA